MGGKIPGRKSVYSVGPGGEKTKKGGVAAETGGTNLSSEQTFPIGSIRRSRPEKDEKRREDWKY